MKLQMFASSSTTRILNLLPLFSLLLIFGFLRFVGLRGFRLQPEADGQALAGFAFGFDLAAVGYAAAAVTAAFVGWGAYRIGSEVYLKYLLPKDVLLPQNRIQLAELLWEDAGRPAPADAAPYADVDANDTDARQAARWAVENGLLTLPNAEKPEEFAPYRSVSYAKSARAWNKAQQLKENAAR